MGHRQESDLPQMQVIRGTHCHILSSLSASELGNAIASGNDKLLKSVKGIGLKTAQRIIVDLKDKVLSLGITQEMSATGVGQPIVESPVKEEAVSALVMLGFSPAPSAKVVDQVMKDNPGIEVQQVVKLALKLIK